MTRIVAISGGSGAGKTTIARALAARLGAALIAEDDYYRCASSIAHFDPATHNFDDPAAKDHALLIVHLRRARNGEAFDKPLYDLKTHRRRDATEHIAPGQTLIVEGIHLLAPADLRALFDVKIFVHADEALRLGRRVVRDTEERSRTPREIVAQFFTTVRPMHARYIEPQRAYADLVLESVFGEDQGAAAAHAARIAALLERH